MSKAFGVNFRDRLDIPAGVFETLPAISAGDCIIPEQREKRILQGGVGIFQWTTSSRIRKIVP